MTRDVFQGLADPTRREILTMIAHKSLNVNSVASNFDVSRTAIYKHLKILSECGLVVLQQQGRERYCEARPEKLNEVSDWVEQYRQIWTKRFDALDAYLMKIQAQKKTTAKPKKHGRKK
ncbi:MAG: winged helix-turn-helix transcriptional regulator [Cyclobacteriaceae bacterium]|nr:winged helix-turn-helix transcriptional regulator [Cyclobacteriaceae bacterium]